MGLIEDNLRILQSMELSQTERKLADKVQEAYSELEYETGAALLAHFVWSQRNFFFGWIKKFKRTPKSDKVKGDQTKL